jgi:hypothetical protein
MEYWNHGILRDLLSPIVSIASGALMADFALRGLQMAQPPLIAGEYQGKLHLSERQQLVFGLASFNKLMVLNRTKSWRKKIE